MPTMNMKEEAGITHSEELTAEMRQFLDFIKEKKLESPAIFMLELYRPLVFLGDSLITVFNPFLTALSVPHKLITLFRDRSTVEILIEHLNKAER